MKNVMTAELSFPPLSVCAAHIWRKHCSSQLSATGRETCRSDIHDKLRCGAAKRQQMNLKNTHEVATKTKQRRQLAVLTNKLSRENLFVAANEGTDLWTSWLIIYPAGFMALINFPLSLFTFHSKSEVNLHLVLITPGSQQPPSSPSNPPTRTTMRESEQLSYTPTA